MKRHFCSQDVDVDLSSIRTLRNALQGAVKVAAGRRFAQMFLGRLWDVYGRKFLSSSPV